MTDARRSGRGGVRQADQALEQRVEERTRELTALLAVSTALSSTLDLEALLGLLIDQIQMIAAFTTCAVVRFDADEMHALEYRGPVPRETALARRASVDRASPAWQAMRRGEAIIIDDIFGDAPNARAYRANVDEAWLRMISGSNRAWLGVPLLHRGDVVGGLVLTHNEPGFFTPRRVALIQAIAGQAAAAIENARIVERERQSAQELTTLLAVARGAASTLELEPLLNNILDTLKLVVDYDGASIGVVDGDEFRFLEARGAGSAERRPEMIGVRLPMRDRSGLWEPLFSHEPVIIADVRDESDAAAAFRRTVGEYFESRAMRDVRSFMIIPLVNRDRLVGLLTMSNRERGVFTERHAGLALAIATHIAAALENARLYDQTDQRAHELATLLEVSTGLGTTLELEPLLDVILEQLKVVADYRAAAISIVEDDRLHELRRRTREGDIPPTREVSLVHAAGWWHTVARGEPVIIGDVQSEESLAEAYRTTARHAQNATPVYVIHSFMAVPLTAKDRVMGTIVLSHEQPGFYTERHAALATAIAAQAAAAIENARLHAQTERRTHELSTLLDISRTLSSTLELEPLLGLILDQLRMVVDYTSATAITREGGCYLMREYRGQLPRDEVLSRSLPVDAVDNLIGLTPQGTALIIPDVWADTPAADAYRATGSEEYLRTAPSYVGCLLNAPLIYKGRLIGLLTLGHRTPGHFTEHHAALTQAVADQVAGLIEHARLFEQEQRTSQELATLLEVARAVASTLDLSLLFDLVLEQLKTVVDYRGATLGTIDGDELLIVASHAVTPERSADRGLRFPLRRFGPIWEAIRRGQPAIIADVRGDEPAAVEYRALNAATMDGPTHRDIRSWMAVPLALGDRVIGMLSASQDVPDYFTPHHAELALAFANQVAVAVENARLFAESQGKAALEERQRLARELHDSVSQALFGIALGAGAARRRLDLDPSRVAESLDYVLSLADVALTEMRALIFELRPEALEKDGLVAALTRHAAATRVRHEVTVETVFCEEPDVPLATKEALYRIAQEAMHNAVKHARASRIDVTLSSTSTSISVEVNDDGVGFDPSQDFAGHLGLHSMRERMAVVGGTTDITSAPGQGACIRATAPAR